ncbi:hypothetical protein PIB30_092038 [Stylosanthes scabra]|uniref:Uncharacterized protein n=1 Tax=Stylosanthes scabra TaxID=79078 RepID=A0ABU6QVU9_9FABA|nr:hypothetical protein [Stylosanthes scabra]
MSLLQHFQTLAADQHLRKKLKTRAVAMSAIDGLMREMKMVDTGAPLSLPIGRATFLRLSQIINLYNGNEGRVDLGLSHAPPAVGPALGHEPNPLSGLALPARRPREDT